MQPSLTGHGAFLWSDLNSNRSQLVKQGQIAAQLWAGDWPVKVANGLIHDWVGDAFIAHTTLKEVVSVVSDYDQYKEFYRPTVVASRTLTRSSREDRFSMVLMNKTLFLRTALDSTYECSSIRVSDRRWYTVAETTGIQEIENYGAPGQHTLPEGEGNGFIWRLFSITRLEERDGGVYIELEAIALSRDIPISVRWIVEPIVRRISRNSLETCLRQTEAAVHSRATLAECAPPMEPSSTVTRCESPARIAGPSICFIK